MQSKKLEARLFIIAEYNYECKQRGIIMKENILFQLDMCWQLYLYHMNNLEEAETLWVFNFYGRFLYKTCAK